MTAEARNHSKGCSFKDVSELEHQRIAKKREAARRAGTRPSEGASAGGEEPECSVRKAIRSWDTDSRYTGLALSGGGIRSASFALGVLQALDEEEKLGCIDYLSTVSGGGYIGSSWTWFSYLKAREDSNSEGSGSKADRESNEASGDAPARETESNKASGGTPGSFPLRVGRGTRSGRRQDGLPTDFIRQHGNYLAPGDHLNQLSFGAMVLGNSLVTAALYFAGLVLLMLGLVMSGVLPQPRPAPEVGVWGRVTETPWFEGAVLGILIAFCALCLLSALLSPVRRGSYGFRIRVQIGLGWLLTLACGISLIASLPHVHSLLSEYVVGGVDGVDAAAAASVTATSVGIGGAIFEFFKRRLPSAASKVPSSIRIPVTAFALIYGLLLGAYILSAPLSLLLGQGLVVDALGVPPAVLAGWGDYAVAWVVVLGLGGIVNTNYFGIARMYRDRLMETFLPDQETVQTGIWQPATLADHAPLSEMCSAGSLGPYHLINCNMVLVDSPNVKYRGRGGDSFVLSPLFCGSDATRWHATKTFIRNRMTLASAMATSAAAASPHTGVAGAGPTRDRLVSFLMAFLGLRLGYTAGNPKLGFHGHHPNLVWPGVLHGLLGQRLHAKSRFIELTDGGHFENLGLYELARRRLACIVISDAGADPEFAMADLGNAIERIRVDFGYQVRFGIDERDLQWLMPGSLERVQRRSSGSEGASGSEVAENGAQGSEGASGSEAAENGAQGSEREARHDAPQEEPTDEGLAVPFAKKYGLAQRGYAIGTISYGDGKSGIVVYIKATLTTRLPGDLYAYKRAHEQYPHESTADQFFDERQFEAYRELGFRLAKSALGDPLVRAGLGG